MNNIYEQKSINKLLLTFSIPAIFSLMIEISTSVVDTIFAGNLGIQSADALTAMGILSPLLAIFTALQTLFSVSTAIMIAKYLKDKDMHDRYFSVGLMLSFLVATITSIVFYILLNPVLTALGANENVFILAEQYLKIQLISNIFSSIGYTLTGCIRAFGYPKSEAFIIILSVLVNITFNAIFTFGFSLGIMGIALGTLVSEFLCATIALIWLKKKGLWFKKPKLKVAHLLKISFDMFKIGIAQTLIQALAGATGFFINARLLTFGTLNHVAAWNVVQNIYVLMLMPIVGLAQGSETILAYFGRNSSEDKIKKVTRLSMLYCGIYGLIATIIIIFWGAEIVALFGLSNEMTIIAFTIMKLTFVTFPLTGILYTNMTLLQVTEREVTSVVLILTRQVFSIIPLVTVLPIIFSTLNLSISPVMSIFFAIPIADVFSTIIAIVLLREKPRKLNKSMFISDNMD